MSKSKMMEALRDGLKSAHKQRGRVTEIAQEAGLSPSTVMKVKDGVTRGITTPNFERLWLILAADGHVSKTFDFTDKPIESGSKKKRVA